MGVLKSTWDLHNQLHLDASKIKTTLHSCITSVQEFRNLFRGGWYWNRCCKFEKWPGSTFRMNFGCLLCFHHNFQFAKVSTLIFRCPATGMTQYSLDTFAHRCPRKELEKVERASSELRPGDFLWAHWGGSWPYPKENRHKFRSAWRNCRDWLNYDPKSGMWCSFVVTFSSILRFQLLGGIYFCNASYQYRTRTATPHKNGAYHICAQKCWRGWIQRVTWNEAWDRQCTLLTKSGFSVRFRKCSVPFSGSSDDDSSKSHGILFFLDRIFLGSICHSLCTWESNS